MKRAAIILWIAVVVLTVALAFRWQADAARARTIYAQHGAAIL